MTRLFTLSCILFSLFVCPQGFAAEAGFVDVPILEDAHNSELPQRGQSQAETLQKFGEPRQKIPATGTPPIEKWIYADFSVIFEGKWVIHSVKHRPQP